MDHDRARRAKMQAVETARRSISQAGREETATAKLILEAFSRRDAAAMLEHMHPDARFHAMTGRVARGGEPYVGEAGIREYFDDIDELWSELEIVPLRFEAVTGAVVAFGEVHARGPAGELNEHIVWTWKFRDGRVTEVRVHGDEQAARQALGLA